MPEQHPGWSPYAYVLDNPLRLVDPDGRQVSTIGGFTESVVTARAMLGDAASQEQVKTTWTIRLAGTLALVAAPVLATVALQHPATTAAGLKEATDFVFGLVTDAPDPEGLGGGTLGQAAGRLGDDAARAVAKRGESSLPSSESQLRHIFREVPGHLVDTPMNRALLQSIADDAVTTLGTDRFGNVWSAKTLENGTQVWVQVRNGIIQNGGINPTPRVFNPKTGLSGGDQ